MPVNSGSLPTELLESLLFGHVKGAFTSATANHKGYFETANRGTIFFDEIGTIGPEIQVKLLRVMQDREFMPLGSNETTRVDVRVIAATNADLRKLVEEGKFREDLYYRLNVINLNLPPLRDRKEDLPLLIEHFFNGFCRENEKYPRFRAPLDAQLSSRKRCRSSWSTTGRGTFVNSKTSWNAPLFSPLLRPFLLMSFPISSSKQADCAFRETRTAPSRPTPPCSRSLPISRRRKIIEALETVNQSQTDAAEMLRIPLSTLNQKIKRLNIDVKRRTAR